MSVNSKMTAIADQIRGLRGISGSLSLDTMNTRLEEVRGYISDAFTAIGNKGGTVPSSKVSGNLASAIQSIPEGVTVQKKTGTFTLNAEGESTVNCGFAPDLIEIYAGTYWESECVFTACFNTYTDRKYCGVYIDGTDYPNGYVYITKENAGFLVAGFAWYTDSWDKKYASNVTYDYVAYKFT